MYCTKCGNKVKSGQKFCTKCGNTIEDSMEDLKIRAFIEKIKNYFTKLSKARKTVILTSVVLLFIVMCVTSYESKEDNNNYSKTKENQMNNLENIDADLKETEQAIDNIAKKYNLEEYFPQKQDWARIMVGMTYNEVISILGTPNYTQRYPNGQGYNAFPHKVLTYQFEYNGNYKSLNIIIATSTNTVMEKDTWN